MRAMLQTVACVLFLLPFVGCREEGTRVPVSGTVTQDGMPVKEGRITFAPARGTSGPAAGGKIENGSFQISASEGPGTGDYVISVVPGSPPRKGPAMGQAPEALPARAEAFEFTAEISHQRSQIDLELPSQEGPEQAD